MIEKFVAGAVAVGIATLIFAMVVGGARAANVPADEVPVEVTVPPGGSVTITIEQKTAVPAPVKWTVANCEKALEGHGAMSRAQFQCGFPGYDQGRIADAKACLPIVGEARARELMSRGFDVYDSQEKKWGKAVWCAELGKAVPEFRARR